MIKRTGMCFSHKTAWMRKHCDEGRRYFFFLLVIVVCREHKIIKFGWPLNQVKSILPSQCSSIKKKKVNVALICLSSLLVPAFLIPEEHKVLTSIDCLLISKSHWKTHVQLTENIRCKWLVVQPIQNIRANIVSSIFLCRYVTGF